MRNLIKERIVEILGEMKDSDPARQERLSIALLNLLDAYDKVVKYDLELEING